MSRMPGARAAQSGFSLVELMIASAISLAISAALITVFVGNTRSRTELDRSHQQIENGRYALELLSDELRVAGFYGELAVAGAAHVDATACAQSAAELGWLASPLQVPVPVQAIEPGAAGSGCLLNRAVGTSSMAIRRLSTESIEPDEVVPPTEYLQTSRCRSDPPGSKVVISGVAGDFRLRNLGCTAAMPLRQILQRTYYVASCSNCVRDAIPSLARLELADGVLRLRTMVEGIEALGIDYGFDVNADGTADVWRTGLDGIAGSAADDWGNVMAVRLHVLSRTLQPTAGHVDSREYSLGLAGSVGPFGDGFKRRLYTRVVRLVNPSGRRES